ncbi:MAG: hypothetical protein ACO25B_13630 [Chitinophagaceae bacterium]
MMTTGSKNIENYIPQRPPFVMVDRVTEATEAQFKTEFDIRPENIFLEDGCLREYALIENIAQSSSAGLVLTQQWAGKESADGYIGAISKLNLHALPSVTQIIHTTIFLLARFENMFLIRGECRSAGRLLLECEMKLAGI